MEDRGDEFCHYFTKWRVEATIFALNMGLNNFGVQTGSYLGVVLLAALGGVESPQFENIELWAVLRALCSVLPILLVPVLVPPGSPRGDVGAAAAPSGAP